MTTRRLTAALIAIMSLGASMASAQSAPDVPLAGRWRLNRELSQFPRELGFNADWAANGPINNGDNSSGQAAGGAMRSRFPVARESREDAARRDQLTDEVRNPAEVLTITESPIEIGIADERGRRRAFHPGREESLTLPDDTTVTTMSRLEGGRLVVTYKVSQGRELRYTYTPSANPSRLTVAVEFLERGKGDTVTRVYDVDREPTRSDGARSDGARSDGASAPSTPPSSNAAVPTPEGFDQRPGAQFRGLSKLGVVIEGLSVQATTCGLSQDAIQSTVEKGLRAAGFTVTLNTDEDTYFYVNVMTATLANGLCISRYDASVMTHTAARVEYHDRPVLVDVTLMHKGSLAAGSAASHAASVMKGLQDYVEQFAAEIRAANQ